MIANQHRRSMNKPLKLILTGFLIILFAFANSSCRQKLDEDGGYYDEKSRTYKYVKPRRGAFSESSQKVYAPQPGVTQTVSGTVVRIGDDAKSVWIRIAERKPYMILASSLSGNSRDDQNKQFLLDLSYVSPAASVSGSSRFRQQWKKYAIQVLRNQLENQQVLVELDYEERSRRFRGNIFQTIETANGGRTLDVNLWMIQQGISFYFIEKGRSSRDKVYTEAQDAARKAKLGVWKY